MCKSYAHYTIAILLCAMQCIPGAIAQSGCAYETTGTTVPNTSGTPQIISPVTGTVISANFFNSGAIDPPYYDGLEFVSVCVEPPDGNGIITATITTDVGVDDDTDIKGYPQFVIGTKFGNQSETSFRYYQNTGLPAEQQWPVKSTLLDHSNQPYEFPNLEYISQVKGLGLPAFTSALPDIDITLDIDEFNAVGAERDVMLESWFFDTSANADTLGNNAVTGQPIANTLNNIVGIGHRHFSMFNNTLLEMMVHVGALSPNDISGAKRNPGQHQLTEIYSGKDTDGDGIDDHFDVDSHVNVNSNQDPQPGKYSSGLDDNGDGIDDADFLPITIGSFKYSIWYGETFLSPVLIFSRETNASLQSNFDPTTPDMDLTNEGEITLHWNEFLEYAMSSVEAPLQQKNQKEIALGIPQAARSLAWMDGALNPFPKMSSASGAIGGVEIGVEPQTNAPTDLPYSAVVNTLDIKIDGADYGLGDTINPTAEATFPSNSSSVSPDNITISGIASDTGSGVDRVRVRIQRLGVSPALFWNSSGWTEKSTFPDANLNQTANTWNLSNVDLNSVGSYRIRVIATDNAGNVSKAWQNPKTDFIVGVVDTTIPQAQATFPADSNSISPAVLAISGNASDTESGIARVRVRIQRLGVSPAQFWNGARWTDNSAFPDAILHETNTTWTLPNVDLTTDGNYRIRVMAIDNAGNVSKAWQNPKNDFTIGVADNTIPHAEVTFPADSSGISPAVLAVTGMASDTESGIARIRVRIQRLGVSPAQFWNGTTWTENSAFPDAALNETGTDWTLSDVDLTTIANYRIRVIAIDNAGNISQASQNPKTDFSIQF